MTTIKQNDQRGIRIVSDYLKKHGPMEVGDKAGAVKWAERMLKVAGFDPGPMDKSFTQKTARAISQFQEATGLPVTGELNRATFNALKKVEARVHSTEDLFIGVGQKGKSVLQAEQRLHKLGYNTGKVDGIYDADTAHAVKQFRADEAKVQDGPSSLKREAFNALKQEAAGLNHDPYHARVIKNGARLAGVHAASIRPNAFLQPSPLNPRVHRPLLETRQFVQDPREQRQTRGVEQTVRNGRGPN